MKSNSYWRVADEYEALSDAAEEQFESAVEAEPQSSGYLELVPALAPVQAEAPRAPSQEFRDAMTRTMIALLDLGEQEEEVRLEAVLDDEAVDEIAAAYDIEFENSFERELFCEVIKSDRIWN